MSDDLVKRLRVVTGFIRFETGDRVAASACLSEEAADRIEALTEQLKTARADANEAEAYAEGLERDLKTCRMAQAVMDNTVAEAVKMLDEQDRKYNRMTNDIIERHSSKLAECLERNALLEARLGKAVEAERARIVKILDGIDRTELDDNGWWETSFGEKFGASVLAAIMKGEGRD